MLHRRDNRSQGVCRRDFRTGSLRPRVCFAWRSPACPVRCPSAVEMYLRSCVSSRTCPGLCSRALVLAVVALLVRIARLIRSATDSCSATTKRHIAAPRLWTQPLLGCFFKLIFSTARRCVHALAMPLSVDKSRRALCEANHLRCICPLCFGENRLAKSSWGGCVISTTMDVTYQR